MKTQTQQLMNDQFKNHLQTHFQSKNLRISIIQTQMLSTIVPQSFGLQYQQFLCDLGQAICDKISKDEDVEALNQLQSKQYLFDKIKEIIQSVYQVKNQQLFIKQFQQIQHQRTFIIEQETQIKKLTQALSTQNFNSFHQPQPNEPQSELHKQNWQLNKRLIEQDQQNKMRVKQFAQTIKIMERQLESARAAFTNELSTAIQGIKLWQEKYKTLYQQKNSLEDTLEQQVERHLQEQMKKKEMKQEKQEMELSVEKMTKLNKGMKEQVERLEDKVIRLEKNKQSLEEQIKTYQEEIKALKKVNEELNNKDMPNSQSKNSFGQAKQLIKNLKQVEEEQQKTQKEQRARKMFQLQKKFEKSKQTKQQIELQFHEYKLNTQKRIFELEQEINEVKIRHEKQIRIMKEGFIKEKDSLNESNEQKMKDLHQSIAQKYQQQLSQTDQSLKAAEQKLHKSKSQLKDFQNFMHQKQLHYNQTVHEIQKKNQQFSTYIKQLEKNLKDKHSSSSDYLKQYSMKVEACEDEVAHYKKENQTLRKEIQTIRKQLDQTNFNLITQKNKDSQILTYTKLNHYTRQDQQHYLKTIAQLKQQIFLLQNEQKFILKQTQTKTQTLTQLKANNDKLSQNNQKYQDQLIKLQKVLTNARKQLTELQTNHHKEIAQVYKNHETRIQTEKKQLMNHYEELLKNRQQRLDECRNSTVIYEHQLTITNLRSVIESLREKNLSLEHKVQTLNSSIKDLQRELSQKDKAIQNAKQQQSQMGKELFASQEQKANLEKAIRQKLRLNQLIFRQFKFQLDAYLRTELGQLRETANNIVRMVNDMKTWFTQAKDKFSIQFYSQSTNFQFKVKQTVKSIKSKFDHEVNITHKLAIQQLQQEYSQKLKQHQVETMAEIASRQFLLKQQQKELTTLKNHYDKLQLALKSQTQQHQKLKDENRLIKEVTEKATDKSTKLQKLLIQTQQNLKTMTSQNQSLKQQMVKLEQLYQDKLDKCREKYVIENEKLFSKYEKEFDKLISMNTKVKNTALSSMMSTTMAPTKQYDVLGQNYQNRVKNNSKQTDKKDCVMNQYTYKKQVTNEKKECSKLQNIKKQILLQKKKLQSLDSTKKIPTKGSISSSNLLKNKIN